MKEYNDYLFDLDGTLLNTLDDLHLAVNHALRTQHMQEQTIEETRRFVGNGVRMLMIRSVPGGVENPAFEAAFRNFKDYYKVHATDHTRPYDGIAAVLTELKRRGKHISVVSNKMHAVTTELCRHYFGDTIDVSIGENEEEGIRKKPAPDTLLEALRQTGGKAESAVYVGDSEVDIATARNAAVPCISVLWGFRSREFLISNGAACMITHPSELLLFEEKH